MDANLKSSIWQQFGAAIDFLSDTIIACPDALWRASLWQTPDTEAEFSQFWYVSYHTLFWLDLYLTGVVDGFHPPEPFTLCELEAGCVPERVYTKDELLGYLKDCRQKCKVTINALTNESAERLCRFGSREYSFLELLYYNMRHVHGHASQLNMLLGQHIGAQSDYITQARNKNS